MTMFQLTRRRFRLGRTAGIRIAAVIALVGAWALIVPAGSASAHSSLISSRPAASSVQSQPPGSVELVFDQDVDTAYAQIAVTVGGASPIPLTPDIDGQTVRADLAATGAERQSAGAALWSIGYRVVSGDGHPISGVMSFTVGDGPLAEAVAAQPVSSDGSGIPQVLTLFGSLAVLAALVYAVVRWRRRA